MSKINKLIDEAFAELEKMEGKITQALKDGSKYEAQRVLRELLFDLGKLKRKKRKK